MSEIFSFSANDSKYLMQHKLLLQLNNIIGDRHNLLKGEAYLMIMTIKREAF
jgi:hypothetical protein